VDPKVDISLVGIDGEKINSVIFGRLRLRKDKSTNESAV
jgi:hypothetical protein